VKTSESGKQPRVVIQVRHLTHLSRTAALDVTVSNIRHDAIRHDARPLRRLEHLLTAPDSHHVVVGVDGLLGRVAFPNKRVVG